MKAEYRTGTELDRRWLYALYCETMRPHVEATWGWNEAMQAKGFDEHLGADNFEILIENNKDVAAYCIKLKDDGLWLEMVLVKPALQGTGIGKKIMRHIQSLATGQQTALRLCSMKINPATDFYRKLGYSEYQEDENLSYFEWRSEQGLND
ncbi:MAG: hypothetical protein COB20_15815 [SAR86 cluster bacterium]|uniref:N-acetyltransferase domain-containing protein n=1 Tax=SAR86 cluster bacterium TaxID=2030880 RepID=A0A2A4WTQ5_9GAMM|nr:MAG: hypothetical protein COB20_15815 [SAR86 cluster bacterium]